MSVVVNGSDIKIKVEPTVNITISNIGQKGEDGQDATFPSGTEDNIAIKSSNSLKYLDFFKYDPIHEAIKINGGSEGGNTTSENLYKLQIAMNNQNDYAISVSNNYYNCDPWFHINSFGIGAVGNGTNIPYFSIESDVNRTRELRSWVVPTGDYSYIWAMAVAGTRNDLHLYGNKDVILQAGRGQNGEDLVGDFILQGRFSRFLEYGRGDNRNALVIDHIGGNRMYQFDDSVTLKNLIKTGDGSYISGDFGIGAAASGYKFSVSGTSQSSYHNLSATYAIDGTGVNNGSLFKGTDGSLYYKGNSGTVTKIANS
jgi:hypothetical protein